MAKFLTGHKTTSFYAFFIEFSLHVADFIPKPFVDDFTLVDYVFRQLNWGCAFEISQKEVILPEFRVKPEILSSQARNLYDPIKFVTLGATFIVCEKANFSQSL